MSLSPPAFVARTQQQHALLAAPVTPAAAAALAIGAVAAAALIGSRFNPRRPAAGVWHAGLRKPSVTPPDEVVGAVWAGLDVLLGLTGYRLLRGAPGATRSRALVCWSGCLAGLAGFPAVFFGAKSLGSSTAVSVAMFGAAAGTVEAAAPVDRVAVLAGVPLTLWSAFISVLNEELWRRNRGSAAKQVHQPLARRISVSWPPVGRP
jgi:tryptophan-rich sensory protein